LHRILTSTLFHHPRPLAEKAIKGTEKSKKIGRALTTQYAQVVCQCRQH